MFTLSRGRGCVPTHPHANVPPPACHLNPSISKVLFRKENLRAFTLPCFQRIHAPPTSSHPQLCTKVADAACIAAHDAPTCIKMDQDADFYAHYYVAPSDHLTPAAAAGVAVGVAVAVSVAAAATLLICRCRRSKAQHQQQPGKGDRDLESGSAGKHPDGVTRVGVSPGKEAAGKLVSPGDASSSPANSMVLNAVWSPSGAGSPQSRSIGSPSRSSGGSSGASSSAGASANCSGNGDYVVPPPPSSTWASSSSNMGSRGGSSERRGNSGSQFLPELLNGTMTREAAAEVVLGQLVGAGSFGRVFRGQYLGHEVAIKVRGWGVTAGAFFLVNWGGSDVSGGGCDH